MVKEINITEVNAQLKNATPERIVDWAIRISNQPVVTTNFGPYEASILHLVSRAKNDIPVIWADSGYNTRATYLHAQTLIEQLSLNVDLFVPQQSTAYRDAMLGIPEIDTPAHDLFTKQVKLEPFKRAMEKHQPDVWFTNLRKDQTSFRAELDIVTVANNVIKVSPFFYWTAERLDEYLALNNLSNETNYYDPTKALSNRECGLHTL